MVVVQVNVLASPPLVAETLPSVYVESMFVPSEVEVQEQATYVLRFHQSVSVSELALVPPNLRLAEIRPLGQWQVSEDRRGAVRYRVTEARFAVFPFASGVLHADGAYASGLLADPESGRSVVRRRIAAPPATLRVRSLPSDAGSSWLPARSVELVESWQWHDASPFSASVGMPLWRTLRIVARGVAASQIVGPTVVGDEFIVYGDPPVREDRQLDGTNIAVFEQRWRLVPRAAGVLRLPPISIQWWDVSARSFRTASLPERLIRVADTNPGLVAALANGGRASSADGQSEPIGVIQKDEANSGRWLAGISPIAVITLLSFTTVLLVTWRVWVGGRSWRKVRAACRDNDAQAAKRALLEWSAKRLGGQSSSLRYLPDIDPECDDDQELGRALLGLERACYGPADQPWSGLPLARVLARLRRRLAFRWIGRLFGSAPTVGKRGTRVSQSGPMSPQISTVDRERRSGSPNDHVPR